MPEKLTKFQNFTRFLHEKCPLHNKTTKSRPGRGQNLEAETEAEAKSLASRPLCLEDLTSLTIAFGDIKLLRKFEGCHPSKTIFYR